MSTEAIQDLLTSSFESQMNNQHTSIPCIVISVRDNLSGQMVDIQPTINQKFQDGTVAERPPILGVPVGFPVSKTAGMTFPINVGDTGMAIFSMRSMDAWKAGNGRPTTPLNFAKMDKGDAVFYPGIQPPGMAVNNPAKHVLTHDTHDTVMFTNLGGVEAEMRLKANGSIEINTSNQPVTINCSDATINAIDTISLNAPAMTVDVANTTWIGNISQVGDYSQTGTYTLNSINVNLHVHSGVVSGPSNSGAMV
ncbi:Gp138 family membrane-puncturing spike protein [Pseudomonas sp.]|uniref:Gp138 family membrane-puncturing spike protein n=1 Tax=Pseudomonas sp. TaxID=306 RepID=UPI003FD6C8CF